MARGLTPDELVERLAATAFWGVPAVVHRASGRHTAEEVGNPDLFDVDSDVQLRYGEYAGLSFAVMYGAWWGEFNGLGRVSEGGAHVFQVMFEEDNGKPVPPFFEYLRDGHLACSFNLHLDGSWGYDGIDGDPTVAAEVTAAMAGAGLPIAGREGYTGDEDEEQMRCTLLGILSRLFDLSLPREQILRGSLATATLATWRPDAMAYGARPLTSPRLRRPVPRHRPAHGGRDGRGACRGAGPLQEFASEVFAPLVRRDQREKGALDLRGLLLEGWRKTMQPMPNGSVSLTSSCSSSGRPRPGRSRTSGPGWHGGPCGWCLRRCGWYTTLASPRRQDSTGVARQ
ncbi:hypothetical protein OV450_3009 [Actinobacteria bacterium OV450]|nr:hypothetical protein OV450_3009 [Actinobacteria bacterium OV450]